MIEHLYEDLSVHLYEGEPITKKAPTPPPTVYILIDSENNILVDSENYQLTVQN